MGGPPPTPPPHPKEASNNEPQAFLGSFLSNPKFGKEKECKLRGRKFTFTETFYVTRPFPGALKRASHRSLAAALEGGYCKGRLRYKETESRKSFITCLRSHSRVFPESLPAPRTRQSKLWLIQAKEETPGDNKNHGSPQQSKTDHKSLAWERHLTAEEFC